MEQVLDGLATYLSGHGVALPVATPLVTDITWIVGDVGMGDPNALPFGFIAPFNDVVAPRTGGGHGVDMDTLTIPMLIVLAPHDYEQPIPSANTFFKEQPGFRTMLQLCQNVRSALRANITVSGLVATSLISEMRYVLVTIDNKTYRGCRITLNAQMRRGR